MAIKYGFFNSVNGDRKYNADDISNYFLKLISDGVFATPSNAMQVQVNSGMTVQVSAGWGFIKCKWINNDSPYLLTLDAADVVLDRIDRIVMRLNPANNVRAMSIAVKKGTPSANPTTPALTRVEGGIWELSLAKVRVNAGVTAITQANITDDRGNTNLCGYVTGLIDQIDTTNLFAQYNSAFNTWFDSIKDQVRTTTIVIELNSTYTTSAADETAIPINISQYNETLDILDVYVSGMKLVHDVDYTNDGFYVYLTNPLSIVGTTVEIRVLKSMDTENAQSVVAMVIELFETAVTRSELNERLDVLSFRKMSRAAYTALATKNVNTVYYVYDPNGTITQYMGETPLTAGQATGGVMIALNEGRRASIYGHPTYHE